MILQACPALFAAPWQRLINATSTASVMSYKDIAETRHRQHTSFLAALAAAGAVTIAAAVALAFWLFSVLTKARLI